MKLAFRSTWTASSQETKDFEAQWIRSIGSEMNGKTLLRNHIGFFQEIEHVFRDDGVPLGIGMDSVVQIQLGIGRDPFQQERHEGNLFVFRNLGMDGLEPRNVVGSKVSGNLHADKRYRNALGPDFGNDRADVGVHLLGRKPLQTVVRADAHDREGRQRSRQEPIRTFEKSGGRIAGNPGVRNPVIKTFRHHQLFQLRGIRIFRRKLVSGR